MQALPLQRSERVDLDLSIVVPVYRAEDCLDALVSTIDRELGDSHLRFEIILVNDGSPDRSWEVIDRLCLEYPAVVGINLRRNFGQDNAIMTGLRASSGAAVVIMDDDLQHHPRDIPALLARLDHRTDVVYANFRSKHHAAWKRFGSKINGKLAEWVIDKPPSIYLSPFKAIRREVVELIRTNESPEPYVDGLLFQVTSRIAQIDVNHHPRFAGRSNYSFLKSLRVWLRLATTFSVKPLRLVMLMGVLIAGLGGLLSAALIGYRLFMPEHFPASTAGWASSMVTELLSSGVSLLFLGILGEYVGRAYLTISGKPQTSIGEIVRTGDPRVAVRAAASADVARRIELSR